MSEKAPRTARSDTYPSRPMEHDTRGIIDNRHSCAMNESAQNQAAERAAYTLEDVLWGVAAALFSFLLRYFSELQDALLAIPAIRHMALWALNPNAVQELVDDALTEVRKPFSRTLESATAKLRPMRNIAQ